MKKVIIAAFAVALASVSQAASINWAVNYQSWKMQDDTWASSGTSLWLVDVANQDAIIAALKDKTVIDFAGDWKSAIDGLDGVYATGTSGDKGLLSERTIANDNLIDVSINEDVYNLATLIIDNVSSSDNVYYNISDGTGESYATEDLTGLDTANFSSQKFIDGTGWQVAQGTPEPTSGLLMLIGMAGLALRRRRA